MGGVAQGSYGCRHTADDSAGIIHLADHGAGDGVCKIKK